MTKKNSVIEMILAAAVGVAAFVLLLRFSFEGVHPFVAEEVATAASLIPKVGMLPGLGVYLSHLLFASLPFSSALWLNGLVAKILVALCGGLGFMTFAGGLRSLSAFGARDLPRRQLAIWLASGVSSLALVLSDPMWHAALGLTTSTLVIFEVVLTAFFFVRLLEKADRRMAIAGMVTLGMLCAESPLGWLVLAAGAFVFYYRFLPIAHGDAWTDFLDPVKIQRTKWMMTYTFLGSFASSIVLEGHAFMSLGGMVSNGLMIGDLPLLYAQSYFGLITNAGDVIGWLMAVITVMVPALLALVMIVRATDEEDFLDFKISIVYFLAGLVAYLQLSPFDVFWFWQAVDGEMVSPNLMVFAMLLSAVTLLLAVFVLGVEVLCRNYEHIEEVLYRGANDDGDNRDDDDDDSPLIVFPEDLPPVESVRLGVGRIGVLASQLVLVALLMLGRQLPEDRQLQSFVEDYVRAVVDEAADVRFIFTDGAFDNEIRIESKRRGLELMPISLRSGSSRRDEYVRTLGATTAEERATLTIGAAETLQTWAQSKPETLSKVAAQAAFEILQGKPQLTATAGGLMVRTATGGLDRTAKAIEVAHGLANRAVKLQESGIWRKAKDRYLKERMLVAQFRLAVIGRLRAIALDAKKQVKESLEEVAISDRLNANNPALVKLMRRLDWLCRHTGKDLTPREGLEVALKRADFVMARNYAMPVLKDDPNEPNANFAVGMSYYAEGEYAKAEGYLQKVLKKRPEEPAVFNNLALIYLKDGRLDKAEENVIKALKLRPDSAEIKDTARQVQKAKKGK